MPMFLQGVPEFKVLTQECFNTQTALIQKLKEFIQTKQIININKVDIYAPASSLAVDESK